MQTISEFTPDGETPPVPVQVHGVLIRVNDTGVLLVGESGTGKSECALDLVMDGHQLVADDVIEISLSNDEIVGRAPELTSDLMEIRGLGMINVRELFGESATCSESVIDFCIELQTSSDVERIGNVIQRHSIAGTSVPKFILPVSLGRYLPTLVVTAVRIHRAPRSHAAVTAALLENHAALLESAALDR